jgi:hypothetical protein
MTKALSLRIILQEPVPGIVYGLQKGKGNSYEIVQKQTTTSRDLVFEFTIDVKDTDKSNCSLVGPFTQGTPLDRFVYLNIGTNAGQIGSPWSRRLKIPIFGITKATIESMSDKDMLQCTVPGKGKDGSPSCATVKPFSGWSVVAQSK